MDLIRTSPFKYVKGLKVILDNHNKNCSSLALRKAFGKGIFTETDMVIIETIFTFEVINKNSLEYFINNKKDVSDSVKKKDYTRNLHNLVEHGVLLRYNFVSEGWKSPFVYSLSAGAKMYFGHIFGRGYKKLHRDLLFNVSASPEASLRMVSFNQFLIRILCCERIKVQSLETQKFIKYKNFKLPLDCTLTIKNRCDELDNFIIVCFRDIPDITKISINYFEAIKHHFDNCSIIVLVESLKVAQNIEKLRKKNEHLSKMSVLYLPDVVAISVPPLSCLYNVSTSSDSSLFSEYNYLEFCL